jgi:NDP-sugar pyrophosphorylase family protein
MEVFILAAGLGTRLRPITDSMPKALVEIKGIPLLEILLKKLSRFNAVHIIINVHHFGSQVIGFLKQNNNFGLNIEISDEREQLLDTGGGLKKASLLLKEENFLIHNVDILTSLDLSSLFNFHTSNGCIATLAVQKRSSSRYFLFDEDKVLCGWENIKTGEKRITRVPRGALRQMAFSGIHAGNRELFSLMPATPVFSIVDFYLSIAEYHQITYFDHSETSFIDLGKKENLTEAADILDTILQEKI